MFDARTAVLALLEGNRRGRARRARSRLATVLLLVDADSALLRAAIDGLLRGNFPVDSELVTQVYWSSEPRLRPHLGGLSVVTFLAPDAFRRIWRDAVRRSRTGAQRARLAESLAGFLSRHPEEADQYAQQIRGFCRERNEVARRAGIMLLTTLDATRAGDLVTMGNSLRGANDDARLAALGAIQKWLLRGSSAPPAAKAFIRSKEVAKEVERARRDPDSLVRMAGNNCARLLSSRSQPPRSRRACSAAARAAPTEESSQPHSRSPDRK